MRFNITRARNGWFVEPAGMSRHQEQEVWYSEMHVVEDSKTEADTLLRLSRLMAKIIEANKSQVKPR